MAAEDGGIVGFCYSGPFRARAAYETTIETSVYCAPGCTGRGLGRRLYAALFDALAAEDLHRAIARITLPNDPCVALHERFGFRRVGVLEQVGRKFGRYWDVALYEKALP